MLCRNYPSRFIVVRNYAFIDCVERVAHHNMSSMERTIGVSPFVGGLRGSATCSGLPNGVKGSRGNMDALGENNPSTGVGGDSKKRIPATPERSWSGLFVMVSARGDMSVSSSTGKAPGSRPTTGESAGCSVFRLVIESRKLGKLMVWKPKLPCELKPGVGGGLNHDSIWPPDSVLPCPDFGR